MDGEKGHTMEKEKMFESVKNSIEGYCKKAQEAPQTVYKDFDGKEYRECAGAYNDSLVRAMSHDMSKLWVHFTLTENPLAKEVGEWSLKMQEVNYAILRQIDDFNGDRPLLPLVEKDKEDLIEFLIESFGTVKKALPKDDEFLEKKDIKNRIDLWADRLLYITSWAFYLEQQNEIEDAEFNAEIKMFDNDGNQISGLTEHEERFVKDLCTVRRFLLKAFLRIPVNADANKELLEKLNLLDIATRATLEGKIDRLFELLEEKAG